MDSIRQPTRNIDVPQMHVIAFILAIFTIVYNLLEAIISIIFGFANESFTLFGFGVDSF